MYKIFVENIRCHSFHGCLPEETIIGGEYRVDVVAFLENEKLSGNDDLNETIDYCDVTKIVEDHMSVPCKLIETVCEKICDRVLKISSNIFFPFSFKNICLCLESTSPFFNKIVFV